MTRHPHRKGRKRQRKKREHGTRRQNKWKPLRSTWAAICWARRSGSRQLIRAFCTYGPSYAQRVLPEASTRPIKVGPFLMSSQHEGSFPPVTVRTEPASNGDPGCIDIVLEQGGLELERYRDRALSLDHPSVPQWERDAAERERQELEDS